MSCNVKKHHRKRHPMSDRERVMWEICFDVIGCEGLRSASMYVKSNAFRLAMKRRERDALRDAGRNPYKRGGKK